MDDIESFVSTDEKVETYQIMDKEGNLVREIPSEFNDKVLTKLLRKLVFYREYDKKAVKIQRRGEIGTYPPMRGQEGTQVGMSQAIKEEDWIVPTYREQILKIEKGVPPENIYLYWMGDERGHKNYRENNVLPISVPIGSHIPHGAGIGMGIKNNGDEEVSWCIFGDGATSEGDFHEGMNFGGSFNIPTVFVCQNNQWAISVPREEQTATKDICTKANAYGFEGLQVDGMDVLASYEASKFCRNKALGNTEYNMKPTLLEMVNYRYGPHTTSDDPSKYRENEEVEKWKSKDPLKRIKLYLEDRGSIGSRDIEKFKNEANKKIDDIMERIDEMPPPDPERMIENCYSSPSSRIREQFEERKGDNK